MSCAYKGAQHIKLADKALGRRHLPQTPIKATLAVHIHFCACIGVGCAAESVPLEAPPPFLGHSVGEGYHATFPQLRNMLFLVFVSAGNKVYLCPLAGFEVGSKSVEPPLEPLPALRWKGVLALEEGGFQHLNGVPAEVPPLEGGFQKGSSRGSSTGSTSTFAALHPCFSHYCAIFSP